MNDKPFRLGHIPALDGLRAVAVTWVIAYHYGLPLGRLGSLGVDMFFVLSGFLISSLLAAEWLSTGGISLCRFYLRRALRLLPALWLMLLVFGPLLPPGNAVAATAFASNWAFILGWLPADGIFTHLWSLSIEGQFYCFWPVALMVLLRLHRPRMAVAATLSLAVLSALWRAALWHWGGDWVRVDYGTDTRMDGLLLGSALGLAVQLDLAPSAREIGRALTLLSAAAFLLVAALLVMPPLSQTIMGCLVIPLVNVATAVMIARVAIYPAGLLRQILSRGPLVWIGGISYALYLWHFPIGALVDVMVPTTDHLALATLKVVLSVAMAGLSHRYVESPALRLRPPIERLFAPALHRLTVRTR